MKNFCKRRKLVLLCFMLLLPISFKAQTIVLGTVVDKDNVPVPGARIEVSGLSECVVSDIDGAFKLEVPATSKRLRVSYPGFKPVEYKIRPEMVVRLGSGWGGEYKGYRGFFDLEGGFCLGKKVNVVAGDLQVTGLRDYLHFGFSTTHGYQLNRHLFLGAGIGIFTHVMSQDIDGKPDLVAARTVNIPLFVSARWDFGLAEKTAPFVGIKLGYRLGLNPLKRELTYDCNKFTVFNLFNERANGIFFQPTIGLRTGIWGKCGINIGVSYNVSIREKITGELTEIGDIWGYYSANERPVKRQDIGVLNSSALMLNLGLDF